MPNVVHMHMQREQDITDTPLILTWDGKDTEVENLGANILWYKVIAKYGEFAAATINAAAASGAENEVDLAVGAALGIPNGAVGIIIRGAAGSPSRVKIIA